MSLTDPPRDFQSLQQLIAERAQDLPKRLAQVAGYALGNPDEIAFGTAASIAEASSVQPSTLVRFAQSLGFQGFSDLQDVFRSRLRERVLSYDERLSHLRADDKAHKASLMFAGFAEAAEHSIRELRLRLDGDKLEEAVKLLAKAETIYLVGLRRSFPISSYMSYAFGKLGVKNQLIGATGGLAAEDVSFATPQDVIMAISFTPYASETVKLTQSAHGRGVPVVSITDSAFSPLAPVSKLWFEVTESHFEGFRSLSATLALAMTFTVAVAERRSASKG
ncbi:MAG: MurR/RpiR family transcriptional regulator [Alphaproteobacteria bacterium]|nr:MurR/RpiR family transcriptional regulator [Alphaproteobacteria bacterium]